jgi:hypothetical protein
MIRELVSLWKRRFRMKCHVMNNAGDAATHDAIRVPDWPLAPTPRGSLRNGVVVSREPVS